MSEQANEPFDAVAAFESILSDSNGTPEKHKNNETDADTDEVEAQDEPEDDASDSDAEGDSNEDEAGDSDDLEDDSLVTVGDDNTKEKVSKEEAEKGYLRQSSYTQKMQALAEERKAFEAEQASIREERAQYAHLLGALQQQVSQVQEPDWNHLRQTDPQGYLMARDQWQMLKERQAAIRSEQERLAYDEQVQQVQHFQATVANERQLLLQKHPEFKNEKTWAKVKKEIRQFGRDVMGFSEDELNTAADHRAVSALYTAMKAHNAANAKAEPVKSSSARIPVGTAAATPRKPNAFEAANKRLKSSGKVSDAAEALRHLI